MHANDSAAQAPSASRPTTSGFGKCTESIKCLVPVEVKDDFMRKARAAGYGSESDCLRELAIVFTYGTEYLVKIHADRIRLLSGIGPETDR